MIPEAKLGWFAAILDMKGNIIHKNNKQRATPQLVLMVESKNWNIIRELARLTGSFAEPQKPRDAKDFMRRGCTEHCPDPHVHVPDEWKLPAIARWTITGAGVAIVLHNVLPYMSDADRKGFPLLMDEATENLVLQGQGSGRVRETIRRMETLGWELPPAMVQALEPELRILTA
jgi:hypothetical protein